MERTALHYAARLGHNSCASFLINIGADVNAKDINGESPLHAAFESKNQELIRLLLHHRADCLLENCTLITPMEQARRSNTDLAARMLAAQKETSTKTTDIASGQTISFNRALTTRF